MAANVQREAKALEWAENLIADVASPATHQSRSGPRLEYLGTVRSA